MLSGRALMHIYTSQLIDLLLVLVTAWTALAIIFALYAYFVGRRHPISESVFGRILVVSFFMLTASIWLPIVAGAVLLSLLGHLWSSFKGKPKK
jgi:hypothetical protein